VNSVEYLSSLIVTCTQREVTREREAERLSATDGDYLAA
jgi:hypothetical protein